ncbi:MAG: hypothetical protein KJN76_03530 [Eudoraea sp.]|nr:hypothetical protein [Eudoraea sp.]
MKLINSILISLFNNPLSVMRFALPWLVAKVAYDQLNTIHNTAYNFIPWYSKTWFLQLMPDSWLSFGEGSEILFVVLLLSAAGASMGIAGRLCLFLLAGLEFFIGGSFETLGIFDHNSSLSSQVLLVLALVPGSMRISVDYYIYKRIFRNRRPKIPGSPPPKWGLNLILVLLVLTYFTAGVSKIRHGGLKWLDGATLGFYLENYVADYPGGEQQLLIANSNADSAKQWKDGIGFEAHTYGNYQYRTSFKKLSNWIAARPVLVIVISVITILFEFAWFIVFINSKYRNIYLLAAIITHTMIGVLMGLYFLHYRFICLCLLDWNQILKTFGGSYGKKLAMQIQSMESPS